MARAIPVLRTYTVAYARNVCDCQRTQIRRMRFGPGNSSGTTSSSLARHTSTVIDRPGKFARGFRFAPVFSRTYDENRRDAIVRERGHQHTNTSVLPPAFFSEPYETSPPLPDRTVQKTKTNSYRPRPSRSAFPRVSTRCFVDLTSAVDAFLNRHP